MDFTGGITLGKRRREDDDIFDGIAGDENENQDQEFEMHINLHEKEKSMTFDLTLPSLSKIEQLKAPKNNFLSPNTKPLKQVTKEDEIKYTLLTDTQIDTISNKRKMKG